MEARFLSFLVWGVGTVLVYLAVLVLVVRQWHDHKDARSRREVMSAGALFLTALGSAAAITLVLFGEAGTGPRSFAIAVALGCFTGAGIVMLETAWTRRVKGKP